MVQAFEEAAQAGKSLQLGSSSSGGSDPCYSTPRTANSLGRGDTGSPCIRRSRLATVVSAFQRRLARIKVRPEAAVQSGVEPAWTDGAPSGARQAARAGGAVRTVAHRRVRSLVADLAALADTVKLTSPLGRRSLPKHTSAPVARAAHTVPMSSRALATCVTHTAPGTPLAETEMGAEVLRLAAGRCSTVGVAAAALCIGALISLGTTPRAPQGATSLEEQPQLAFVVGADGALHVCTSGAPLPCEGTRVVRVALAEFSSRHEVAEVVTAANARHGVAVSSERSWARLLAGLNAALLLSDAGPGAAAAALSSLPIERMPWSPRVEGVLV
jgi:hypothetical protein